MQAIDVVMARLATQFKVGRAAPATTNATRLSRFGQLQCLHPTVYNLRSLQRAVVPTVSAAAFDLCQEIGMEPQSAIELPAQFATGKGESA